MGLLRPRTPARARRRRRACQQVRFSPSWSFKTKSARAARSLPRALPRAPLSARPPLTPLRPSASRPPPPSRIAAPPPPSRGSARRRRARASPPRPPPRRATRQSRGGSRRGLGAVHARAHRVQPHGPDSAPARAPRARPGTSALATGASAYAVAPYGGAVGASPYGGVGSMYGTGVGGYGAGSMYGGGVGGYGAGSMYRRRVTASVRAATRGGYGGGSMYGGGGMYGGMGGGYGGGMYGNRFGGEGRWVRRRLDARPTRVRSQQRRGPPPSAWQGAHDRGPSASVVGFAGKIAWLVDENSQALHFFMTALLGLLDRGARAVRRARAVRPEAAGVQAAGKSRCRRRAAGMGGAGRRHASVRDGRRLRHGRRRLRRGSGYGSPYGGGGFDAAWGGAPR